MKYVLLLSLLLVMTSCQTVSMNYKLEAANSGGGVATVVAVEEGNVSLDSIRLASDAIRKALKGDLGSAGVYKLVDKHLGQHASISKQIIAFLPSQYLDTKIKPEVKAIILEFLDGVDHRVTRWKPD